MRVWACGLIHGGIRVARSKHESGYLRQVPDTFTDISPEVEQETLCVRDAQTVGTWSVSQLIHSSTC